MRGRLERRTWRHDPTVYAAPRLRRACSYDVFFPNPLGEEVFDLQADVAAVVSEAERAVIELNHMADPALKSLSRMLLRTESIASSKVEGMHADIRSIARAEARRSLGRSISRQVAEIIANIDAMQIGVDHVAAGEEVSSQALCEIHSALMSQSIVPLSPGKIRSRQNWIGGNDINPCGAAYVPPPAEEVTPLLDDLSRFCNSDLHPPMVQAAVAHAQFETIHPFDDGNGRTGRALVQVLLKRCGLAPEVVPPISIVLYQRRDSYIRGLTNFRQGQVGDWLLLFAEAMAQAAQLAIAYRGLVADLQEFWRERLRLVGNPRADAAAWSIIDALPAFPVVSVADVANAIGRSEQNVRQAVTQLEEAGVLTRIGTSRRYRLWEPQGLLDLISELENGELPAGVDPLMT